MLTLIYVKHDEGQNILIINISEHFNPKIPGWGNWGIDPPTFFGLLFNLSIGMETCFSCVLAHYGHIHTKIFIFHHKGASILFHLCGPPHIGTAGLVVIES